MHITKNSHNFFIDDSANPISLYITSPTVINQPSSPDFVHATTPFVIQIEHSEHSKRTMGDSN